MGDDDFREMIDGCLLARTRIVSRVITGIYDEVLKPFGLSSPQYALLVAVVNLSPASRSAVGRYTHQDRSTLSRNIGLLSRAGWVDETDHHVGGRAKPLVLTPSGRQLLHDVFPVWREGQKKAEALLGQGGAAAIMSVGNGLFSDPELA